MHHGYGLDDHWCTTLLGATLNIRGTFNQSLIPTIIIWVVGVPNRLVLRPLPALWDKREEWYATVRSQPRRWNNHCIYGSFWVLLVSIALLENLYTSSDPLNNAAGKPRNEVLHPRHNHTCQPTFLLLQDFLDFAGLKFTGYGSHTRTLVQLEVNAYII